MSAAHALVLGAVQGLTEFIPISSSGHLVLVPEALGWDQPGLAFDVLLHMASLVALVAYFWNDLFEIVRGVVTGDARARRLATLLVVATIPAAIAGVALKGFFEGSFSDASSAALQLVITAAILVAAEQVLRWHQSRRVQLRGMDDLSWVDAGLIGIAQAVSILPGISRSGATIGAGLALKMDRDVAARFAFLIAIPALLGAAIVEIPDLVGTDLDVGAAVAGFSVSLATSYLAIAGLIRYLRTRSLYPFAAYCVVAGVVFYALV